MPLLRAFRRIHDRAMVDAGFRRQFCLVDWEETLLADDPGFSCPTPTSRLDFFAVPGSRSLGLTEYNAETPAGAAYGDTLSDVFLDLPAMREFARAHEVTPLPARHGVTGALLDAWREFHGRTPDHASRFSTGTTCPRERSSSCTRRSSPPWASTP